MHYDSLGRFSLNAERLKVVILKLDIMIVWNNLTELQKTRWTVTSWA